jgi:hypothetical protein
MSGADAATAAGMRPPRESQRDAQRGGRPNDRNRSGGSYGRDRDRDRSGALSDSE